MYKQLLKNNFKLTLKPFVIFIIILTAFSCIPQKEYLLLQNKDQRAGYVNPYDTIGNITDRYFLQVNDYLYINVSTPEPKLSEFFNNRSGGMAGGQQGGGNYFNYLIDDSMNIDFPYVGKVNLAGCNLKMAKQKISEALKPFLKEFNLKVKLANPSFTAIGELGTGILGMDKDQVTIFEAIAKAGGINIFGKAKDIKLLRQLPEGPVTYSIDITDKNIINSDFYYIYPNDVIYVRPMRAKQWGIGESFSLGLLTTAMALYLTVITFTK